MDPTHEAESPRVDRGLILLFSTVAGFLVFFGAAFAMHILFLSKGRLSLGLIIGITSFLVFTVVGLSSTLGKGIRPDKVRELLPAFLLIVIADGFMEEMLFRGLFLKRLGRFVGENWANLVTATVFTFMHLGGVFTASLPIFLMFVFLLGLLWGWIMQRTGSVLAPALFHAGVDMLIIADAFVAFGISI